MSEQNKNPERSKITYVLNEKTKSINIVMPHRGLALQFDSKELIDLVKDLKDVQTAAIKRIKEIEKIERKLIKQKIKEIESKKSVT